MTDHVQDPQGPILSRIDYSDSAERERDLAAITPAARSGKETRVSYLLLGARHVGKTEIMRRAFDRLFLEGGANAPIYYAFRTCQASEREIAQDFVSRALVQLVAFRTREARLVSEFSGPIETIAGYADREDLAWVKQLLDRMADQSPLDETFSVPGIASHQAGLTPVVMLDNVDRLARSSPKTVERLFRSISSRDGHEVFVLSGLERPLLEMIPADEELLERLVSKRIEPLDDRSVESLIRASASRLAIEVSDSTAELIVQQLRGDLFYVRAVLDAAAARGISLKSFVDFEKVYAAEVIDGRIGRYFAGLLREIARSLDDQRAALETLRLLTEASGPLPIDTVVDRIRKPRAEAEALLSSLNSAELLELNYSFVRASDDVVIGDYVRAVYRDQIVGSRRAVAGEELLRDKLKSSYRLMMSRYNRSVESQLVELLSRFDFQNVAASLLDQREFDDSYRAMSRVQTRRSLEEEEKRVRLPQMVLVKDAGTAAEPGMNLRLLVGTGFEGGIYSEANEVQWLIALINSKEPLDDDALVRIDHRFESALRGRREAERLSGAVRWYISKEGFTESALDSRATSKTYFSTYLQLDLLHECVTRSTADESTLPASAEFELVIPIEDEAELIAARTVEQIARSADFDQEAINQIKTALIEACINAAEHSDSPDRRIHQRFALADDRLTVTVRNKGKSFGFDGPPSPRAATIAAGQKASRGRGLQIIRALMDEVHFERTDDGASLVMTKFLKRPDLTEQDKPRQG